LKSGSRLRVPLSKSGELGGFNLGVPLSKPNSGSHLEVPLSKPGKLGGNSGSNLGVPLPKPGKLGPGKSNLGLDSLREGPKGMGPMPPGKGNLS